MSIDVSHLDIADRMAREWVERDTDPNEVAKALTYLRSHPDGRVFFSYLRTVQEEGGATVVRSGRTLQYYYAIHEVCQHHLRDYQDDPQQMALILGWAVRLMRYHKVAPRLTPPTPPRLAAASGRRTGRVRWFDEKKGYGFIRPDGGGDDVFAHISQTPGRQGLQEDQRVSFVMGKGPKGRSQAQNVQPE